MRILIIEDEKELSRDLATGLIIQGYAVDYAYDGNSALDKVLGNGYDLIILDLNIPCMSGFEILKEINKQNIQTKVMILSANSQIESKLKGFDLGALDYMTKPFYFKELEARIRLLIHREFIQNSLNLTLNTLTLDVKKRIVLVSGEEVKFTPKEIGLLEYFLLNRSRLISQQELIEHVWDESVDEFSNSIRVHLSSLRKKLKKYMGYDPILTKFGEGYIIS